MEVKTKTISELKKELENSYICDSEEAQEEFYWKLDDKVKTIHNSGLIEENTFLHTIFLNIRGKYYPFAIIHNCSTDSIEIIRVINNSDNLIKQGILRSRIKPEDYFFYFEYNEVKYKYLSEDLFFKDTYKINTINNSVIDLIKDKEINKDIYKNVKDQFKEYWDHIEDYEYDIRVASSINTYLLRAINKNFYEIFQGKEDTGKSTAQKVSALLHLNGRFGGKGTVALSSRLIDFLGISLQQDEFDKLHKDEKTMFVGCANTGLYPDGTYEFVDTSKRKLRDQITILHTYSKRTFSTNNISQFDKSFQSRCHIVIGARQNRKLKDINDLSNEEIEKFQRLRNDQFVYCMFNWKKIKESVNVVKEELEDSGVFGRRTDITSLILGIIKHFKGDYYLEVKDYLEQKEGLCEQDKGFTKEGVLFEYLVKRFLNEDKAIEVSNNELTEYLSKELNLNENEEKGISRTIGWILKNNNILRRPNHSKKGSKGRKYIIEKSILLDTLNRFQYNQLYEMLIQNLPSQTEKTEKTENRSDVSDVSDVSDGSLGIDIKEETIK